MRPPFGDIDERVRAILKNMGLTVVTWNVDSGDSAGSLNVAAQFRQYAASNSGPVISLEHDLFQSAEAQAASALDAILAGGYTIQPVDACTGITPSYDESFWSLVDGTTIASSSSAAASSTTAAAKPTTAASATSAASSTPTQRSSNGAISVTTTSVAALSALVAGVASFFIGTVVV
nr:hypothetical protein HK105_005039 [Polyrhizophydium stewartii]